MWLKWFPWRFIVRSVARRQGFIDPISMLAQFQNFSQPSDVLAPKELLREGMVLHARGLMNSQAIQHNLDWVWPFWVERQFDPSDKAFVPRAFSLTQINLTHRNWTAVGIPDLEEFPIVDPSGLVTPLYDGWSIDAWVLDPSGVSLIPSRLPAVSQRLVTKGNLAVVTASQAEPLSLASIVEAVGTKESPACQIRFTASSGHPACLPDRQAWLVISLRPYNPEGVSFIHEIELLEGRRGWKVDQENFVYFEKPADQYEFSYYRHGDVYSRLPSVEDKTRIYCEVGMATAAALFKLHPDNPLQVTLQVPLDGKKEQKKISAFAALPAARWDALMEGRCQLRIPDGHFQFLYDAALRTLVLHSPKDVYPGPYTYRRFWFRDAAFILYAMLCAGFTQRVQRAIDCFPARQQPSGYFLSQDGEWDSNGEALWIIRRFCEMTKIPPSPAWLKTIGKGGAWITRKRLPARPFCAHAGLLPAGFSAEHLGPNDYYYWDNFWGIAGLQAAAYLEKTYGNNDRGEQFDQDAREYLERVDDSLSQARKRLGTKAMPAAPYRRMDSGAIGSLAAGYPLQIFGADDGRLLETVKYFLENCFFENGFFHDMTHSGVNPYLTLHIAQVLLRAGDKRYFDLMNAIAALASPTGQWPEAIHPRTKGGCMGDGQHVWAAAEWVLMVRNCFLREEDNRLILCSGIPLPWLDENTELSFGPAATLFGTVNISIQPGRGNVVVGWTGKWFDKEPEIEVCVPGLPKVKAPPRAGSVVLEREGKP
ncbi:MAG: hypothetical protein HZA29_05015 [Candidatus Omnitrophica bacterium]|nr:hypothetical protein [Candidatus Omnitrophota bacterium]